MPLERLMNGEVLTAEEPPLSVSCACRLMSTQYRKRLDRGDAWMLQLEVEKCSGSVCEEFCQWNGQARMFICLEGRTDGTPIYGQLHVRSRGAPVHRTLH